MAISTIMLGLNQLQIFTVYTLVDITCTGVLRYNEEHGRERNQQRNWETALQVFALRAQPMIVQPPVQTVDAATSFEFGADHSSELTVWQAKIGVEAVDVFRIGDNLSAILTQDFDQVPVITGLTETAKFNSPVFVCAGPLKNIYFKLEQPGLNTNEDATCSQGRE